MAPRLSIHTTFLIDLQRERAHGDDGGAAHRFLKRLPDAELYLSTIALGEFAEGFDQAEYPVVEQLRRRGELIGSNDLWIGCTSLQLGIPIVTANTVDFRRIDGLGIVEYR